MFSVSKERKGTKRYENERTQSVKGEGEDGEAGGGNGGGGG
jgi:hypothetical protein